MPEHLTSEQRKNILAKLGNDSLAQLKELEFNISKKNLSLQDQQVGVNSQRIMNEQLQLLIQLLDLSLELSSKTGKDFRDVAAGYKEYALYMIRQQQPSVEAIKGRFARQKEEETRQNLENKGVILK